MSNPYTLPNGDLMVEAAIEQSIHDAILANVNSFAGQCSALQSVSVNGGELPSDENGNPGARRDSYTGPRIDIICAPAIPHGFQGGANPWTPNFDSQITIDCITLPDSDPDRSLARYMHAAARMVWNRSQVNWPAGLTARGYLIESSSAGVTDAGFLISFSVKFTFFYQQATITQ